MARCKKGERKRTRQAGPLDACGPGWYYEPLGGRPARLGYCTFAVTVDEPVNVNVQVFLLLPPLEQAPDQMASRPFDTLSVMLVPDAKDAAPLLPVLTLMPDGVDVTRSPLRPVAVTVSVAFCGGGGGGPAGGVTVRTADRCRGVVAGRGSTAAS